MATELRVRFDSRVKPLKMGHEAVMRADQLGFQSMNSVPAQDLEYEAVIRGRYGPKEAEYWASAAFASASA